MINSCGESESTWKMPLWILTSVGVCPYAVNSTLLISMTLMIKFITCHDILNISKILLFKFAGSCCTAFCSLSFFLPYFYLFKNCYLLLLLPSNIFSALQEIVCSIHHHHHHHYYYYYYYYISRYTKMCLFF